MPAFTARRWSPAPPGRSTRPASPRSTWPPSGPGGRPPTRLVLHDSLCPMTPPASSDCVRAGGRGRRRRGGVRPVTDTVKRVHDGRLADGRPRRPRRAWSPPWCRPPGRSRGRTRPGSRWPTSWPWNAPRGGPVDLGRGVPEALPGAEDPRVLEALTRPPQALASERSSAKVIFRLAGSRARAATATRHTARRTMPVSVPSKPSASAASVGRQQVGSAKRLRGLYGHHGSSPPAAVTRIDLVDRYDGDRAAARRGQRCARRGRRPPADAPRRGYDHRETRRSISAVSTRSAVPLEACRVSPRGPAAPRRLTEVRRQRSAIAPARRGRTTTTRRTAGTASAVRTDQATTGTSSRGSRTLLTSAPTRVPEPAATTTTAASGWVSWVRPWVSGWARA